MKVDLLTAFCSPAASTRMWTLNVTAVCYVVIAWDVYATGGAQFATLHLMYVPVIVSGLIFGTVGGIGGGVIAALLLGPYMPLNTTTGEAQQLYNWLYRGVFLCMVGGIVGAGAGVLRKQLKILMWLNDHDARTGLLDHMGLLKILRQMIFSNDAKETGPFLIVVQIKNFQDIQNTLGLDFAEQLRKQICERGRRLMPADVPIALIQADRLAAVFKNRVETQQLRIEIETQIRKPYEIDGVPFYVDFAIGAAEYPTHALTAEELLQKASIATHIALIHKRPFCCYDSATDRTSRDNLFILGLIPTALTDNEFVIWHQAKFSLASGEVSGTEALLRWPHPVHGLLLPGKFIPQVEETALINHLTKWVIHSALADESAWTTRGHSMNIAINLSVRNLHDRALLETLHHTIRQYGIDPQRIELEITESAVMDDLEYCGQLISRLRDRGYRVSIDDFGIGHSSFAYLKNLPVSTLKIDQIFVKNLAHNASDQKIVQAIINLAKSLDLETVAEGVEDGAALTLLRDWGCNYAQGFWLHKPAPYDKLLAWIEDGREWKNSLNAIP